MIGALGRCDLATKDLGWQQGSDPEAPHNADDYRKGAISI